jgi:hypothetical protein
MKANARAEAGALGGWLASFSLVKNLTQVFSIER